jgi:putative transposase
VGTIFIAKCTVPDTDFLTPIFLFFSRSSAFFVELGYSELHHLYFFKGRDSLVRKNRVWFEGAKYHITSRGMRKLPLFYDDYDRLKYLSLLIETKERYPFHLQAFCLMTNHIHLQIESIETTPSLILKHSHTKYAKYFNKRYGFSGHVFESRYGSELITSIDYELEVNRYIHLNPVKANLVKNPENYRWSSYRTYFFQKENPLLSTHQILSYFPNPPTKNYLEYMKKVCPENISLLKMEEVH